ncbi:MAG: phosphoribosylglycinamide formyltransferase [Pseudomonadota bacterium]
MMPSSRVVVMLSGGGSNLQALIDATASPAFPAKIVGVISDRPDAYGLQRAAQSDIPSRCVERDHYATRTEFEHALARAIADFDPDFVLLAGFMRILRGDLPDRYAGRMLNIHPSLLPRHKGLDTHQRAIDAGDIAHGCTVHFVTRELDAGPALIQARLDIADTTNAEQLAAQVLKLEHKIYPLALRWLAEARVELTSNGITLDRIELPEPVVMDADGLDC